MGEKSDEIAREIEERRAELGSNLQDLEQKVKGVTDWRQQFQKRPFAMLGLAFGGGLLLSRMIGGRASDSH